MSAPNYRTPGKVGSVHVDPDTGKSYICSSIYSTSAGDKEYTWREIVDVVKETEKVEVPKPVAPTIPLPKKEEPKEEPKQEVEAVIPEPEYQTTKPRNYYSKQYNKNKYNR